MVTPATLRRAGAMVQPSVGHGVLFGPLVRCVAIVTRFAPLLSEGWSMAPALRREEALFVGKPAKNVPRWNGFISERDDASFTHPSKAELFRQARPQMQFGNEKNSGAALRRQFLRRCIKNLFSIPGAPARDRVGAG